MKKIFVLLLFAFPIMVYAQEKGMHFEHGLSWAEVKAKAKTEHKSIFMDCFTTWCGPCKYMSANIFPLEEVGNFMNEKFICVKVQLDTTAADNDEVKSWYQDGHDIANNYQIRAYPSYLYFDENGVAVHRSVGGSPAAEFLAKAKSALNPETQYYSLLSAYKAGKKDSASLKLMAKAAMDAYDMENAKTISNEYLSTQTNLFTKENLSFLQTFTETSKDKGFDIMKNNADKVDAIMGKGVAGNIVQGIIMREEVYRKFPQDAKENPDWAGISLALDQKYPKQSAEVLAKAKIIWYQHAGDWKNYQTTIVAYMNKYGENASPQELNSYAWTVFENCADMKCVAEALDWSKRSFKDIKDPAFIDTYANILYKLGKKDEAIEWEQKAMDIAEGNDKKSYQETMDKMKNGEKTWN